MSQSSVGYFFITGSIKVEQGLVDDAQIQIFKDEKLLNSITVNRTGNFRVRLDLNHNYRFSFSKEGYYAKTIEVDAHIPADVCNENCVFPPYQLALMLYKQVPGVTESVSEVGRVSYNPKIDNFDAELLQQQNLQQSDLEKLMVDARALGQKYLVQSQKMKDLSFDDAIKAGDTNFAARNYKDAMSHYRDAVLLKPDVIYPRDQVDKCYKILVEQELKEILGEVTAENFVKYLNYGDAQMQEREFTYASICYQKALSVKPDDQTIINKLDRSKTELAAIRKLALDEVAQRNITYASRKQKYDSLIGVADEQFTMAQLAIAKDFYATAAMQINENSYALLMIKNIEDLISNDELARQLAREREEREKERLRKARNMAYNDAIAEADRLFNNRLYRDAIETYQLALNIKNYEIYPKQQIKIIEDILAALQIKGEQYNQLLRNADALFNSKDYENAKPLYIQAHQLIPEELYALNKLSEIDRLLKQKQDDELINNKYMSLIKAADQLYEQQKYSEALNGYQQALMVKPDENYPKQQIKEIRGILSREANEQKRLAQQKNDYDKVIEMADKAFKNQSYSVARSLYQEALLIFPAQAYPSSQIEKIDAILEERASRKAPTTKLDQIDFANLQALNNDERKAAYDEAMRLAGEFVITKEWGIARFYYRRALALFPNDSKATEQLAIVDRMILGDNVNEAKYNEMIKKADEAFKTNDFGVAKFYYSKAKEANPNDSYANERLNVVNALVESSAERAANKEFDSSLKRANEAFEAKNYAVARFFYRKALSLKPDDDNIKTQLETIDTLIK